MIIGIDYRFAVTSVRGIGYYIKNVVAALQEIDKINTYYLYVDCKTKIVTADNFKPVYINCKNLILFEQYCLPRQAKADKVDLLWYPSNSGPVFLSKKISLVLTIHDLIFLKKFRTLSNVRSISELRFFLAESYRAWALKQGLKRINSVITISRYSATNIEDLLHQKSTVIYHHINPLPAFKSSRALEKFGLVPHRYHYTLTGIAPHKNLDAYIKLFNEGSFLYPIVVSGVTDQSIIDKFRSEYIIFTGYISEEEKHELYSNADTFLFLSHDEGFGLPVLEAMQHHLPIICADRGSLPEIGGKGVKLVDPENFDFIRALIEKQYPCSFEEMTAKQDAVLARFSSWEKSANQHLEVFKMTARCV